MMKFLLPSLLILSFLSSCDGADDSTENRVNEKDTTTVEEIEISEDEISLKEPPTPPGGFELIIPDTALLKKNYPKGNLTMTQGYQYLSAYYDSIAPKDSLEFYEQSQFLCHFYQEFEHGISYWKSSCGEEGGAQERITFPKIDDNIAKDFVNTLFYDPWNTWTTDLKYEADGAGCYYTIKQTTDKTIIDIWCGC
ncbi:hypothetical protein [Parvicella tangerina]|uniref:Lipoprotein n=1 Tax=Parvicella tangerina TaxID=2829795 RepID=A0A916NH83_9FLAO|nr:hypothetical protein [Parvicella tangerina]CAG5080987.1 hypothetical protein CRYO30217_01505 [Parvicella tangerina]